VSFRGDKPAAAMPAASSEKADTSARRGRSDAGGPEDRREGEEKGDEGPGGDEGAEAEEEEAEPAQPAPETPKEKSYYDEDDDGGKYAYSPEKSPAPPVVPRAGRVLRDAAMLEKSLFDGVRVVKHGRRGNPKHKFLKLSEDKSTLTWSEVQGKRSLRSSVLSLVGSADNEPRSIKVEDITEVRKGVQTEVLVAAKSADPYVCLSILTSERTLDMALDSHARRDLVLRALRVLLTGRDVQFL
jgi:hypothetical protein